MEPLLSDSEARAARAHSLASQRVTSIDSFCAVFEELQTTGPAEELFAFDGNNQISTLAQANLRLSWSWLGDRDDLIHDSPSFCSQFGASYTRDARRKKRKLSESLEVPSVNLGTISAKDALNLLSQIAPKLRRALPDPNDYCDPNKLDTTWEADAATERLLQGRKKFLEILQMKQQRVPVCSRFALAQIVERHTCC